MTQRRRLYLLRHAKSSWDDESLRDDERPLAPRGQRAAGVVQRHFDATSLSLDLVLCSPARRTRETWAGVRAGVREDPEVRFVPAIYAATAGELLDLVRAVDQSLCSVLIIGHNPGVGGLAARLAGRGDADAVARLRDGFPTAGFATLSVGPPWADLDWGSADLDDFLRPRDLD